MSASSPQSVPELAKNVHRTLDMARKSRRTEAWLIRDTQVNLAHKDLDSLIEQFEASQQALRDIIEEFRRGQPRGYDGPTQYEEDDPVVVIARAALNPARESSEIRPIAKRGGFQPTAHGLAPTKPPPKPSNPAARQDA